jgi:hypothetical protein
MSPITIRPMRAEDGPTVAWNRPLYEHLGFRVLDEQELGPELRVVRDRETADGLDPDVRVCMRLDLG